MSSYTEPPQALLEYPEWALRPEGGERKRHRLVEAELHGERLVVRFEGVASRDGAALLTGAWVEVENLEGIALGKVAYFIDAPAGAVMVVEDGERAAAMPGASRREHWVLADPAHLRRVDLAAGRILVDWPAELE